MRTALERIGQPIGGNDLLIAAHARTLRLTVVTANLREFLRVPGLAVENWLEEKYNHLLLENRNVGCSLQVLLSDDYTDK